MKERFLKTLLSKKDEFKEGHVADRISANIGEYNVLIILNNGTYLVTLTKGEDKCEFTMSHEMLKDLFAHAKNWKKRHEEKMLKDFLNKYESLFQ